MEKDYLHFTTNDFIADEFFLRWVKFPDTETNDFWNKWITDYPAKRESTDKAREFICNLSFNTDFPPQPNIEASLARSLELIGEFENNQVEEEAKATSFKKYWWAAAAVVSGIIIFTASVFFNKKPATIEIIAAADEIKSIVLPDSSVITLNVNSSIKYASDIGKANTREVWLKGEGFFNVKHIETSKKARHFIVHYDDLNVEVLGTSFNLKKRKDVYNVSLNTGKIKISINGDEGSTLFLKSGDFFQYSAASRSILKKKVKPELYSDWKEQKMVLNNTSLSELAELIHDSYGYNTVIQDTELSNQKITGTIMLKDEKVFFETLSYALNISIIKKNKDLIFQSKTKSN
ncbi:FecR domain-containing protein [Segetibacter sp.]|jgi:transmembrane sensor|uniref:FecR family protein n=1 Tax=Segetibacter sp. TaxID=2231182 RepID=UPI00261690D5|nr:FecR domain-containing protein [Segetibacter sp.]MCW3079447.1 Fe2+-dicitrate sensor, rane component [Segetibacter sp.]